MTARKTPAKMTGVKVAAVRKPRGGQKQHTGITDGQVATLLELRAAQARCGAKVRTAGADKWDGARCPNLAGNNTAHGGYGRCSNHGGNSPGGARHGALLAARAEAEAVRDAARFFGSPSKVSPEQALAEELQRTHGIVNWLSEMISRWGREDETAELLALLDPSPDWTAEEIDTARMDAETFRSAPAHDHDDVLAVSHGVHIRNPATGLPDLVAVHSTERALGFTDTEYQAWRKVLLEERQHLAKVAKMCIDAGIEERTAQALQARSLMMVKVLLLVGQKLGMKLTEDDLRAELQAAVRSVLSVVPDQKVIQA